VTLVRLSATPRCISSVHQPQSFLLCKQTVDGLYLPVFRYTAAVDFIQHLAGLAGSAHHRNSEIPAAVVESEIRVADLLQVSPLSVAKPTQLTDAFRTIRSD